MKKAINSIKDNYGLVLIVLAIGFLLGWLIFHPAKADVTGGNHVEGHEGHEHAEETPTIWTCSMHPQIKQDQPGQCPICAMDLIPLVTSQTAGQHMDPDEIVLTEAAAQLANIQTQVVTKGNPQKTLYLQGKVHADERNMAELTARFGGRIEKLHVNFTGQKVQKGEKLATMYSPDLLTAQRELLEALSFKESRPSFYSAARAKLRLWDLTEQQIGAIEDAGEPQLYFDVLSPISGTVMMRHVALGDYVKEGDALFQVTDLSRVWVLFDAYESDLPWIGPGDHVVLSIQSAPGKSLEGRVTYIDPVIDPSTRVAKVRIELPNPEGALKPEMFAQGVLHSKLAGSADRLFIPRTSILWTGKRAVVYVKVPDRETPSFLYREITLGPEAGNYYVVEEGLEEGEVIAVNGVFKIDAAAQLEGKASMMNPEGNQVSMGHNHGAADVFSEQISGEVDPAFKEQLQGVYNAYIPMKNAFVKSDAEAVKSAAEKVQSKLQAVDMEMVKGDLHMKWMSLLEILNSEISTMINAGDLSAKRIAFADFNDAFYNTLGLFGLQSGTVYYQYCPMANGDQGAFWLSEVDEIRNPYFGDEMLGCGETRETLEFNE